jgi:transcriptional regulator of acetoin/glycerol metabolism
MGRMDITFRHGPTEMDVHPTPTGAAVTPAGAERAHILGALRATGWVAGGPKGAVTRLGMKRSARYNKMKKLGISRRE